MSYLGKEIGKLGFGLMRLPMQGADVDIEQSKIMVDKFMEAGFTYFDTAYGYIEGKSEEAVKEILVKRYPREAFQLATKLPAWAGAKTAEEAKQMLQTSLDRTGAGYFDYYLLHNLGGDRIDVFDKFGLWDYVQEQKAKGVIKHVGFSLHDSAEVLDDILTKHPEVEFVQLQINYADWESASVQSRACYEVALKHDKPIIIMEPVKGGLLAVPPKAVADILTEANPKVSAASWSLRYAASLDNIITVLSGMSDIAQMEDNLVTMKDFKVLDEAEVATIKRAQVAIDTIQGIDCTGCDYCTKDCPANLAIPAIFGAMNKYLIYDNLQSAKGEYNGWIKGALKSDAANCIACGLCEEVCPQKLHIIEELKRVDETLS